MIWVNLSIHQRLSNHCSTRNQKILLFLLLFCDGNCGLLKYRNGVEDNDNEGGKAIALQTRPVAPSKWVKRYYLYFIFLKKKNDSPIVLLIDYLNI